MRNDEVYRLWYSPSTGSAANSVLRDLGFHFQGQTLLIICYINYRKYSGFPKQSFFGLLGSVVELIFSNVYACVAVTL